jgi:hypothetical protein
MASSRAVKALVLQYASIVHKAVLAAVAAGDIRGWERYVDWEATAAKMAIGTASILLSLEQPAAKKARTALRRQVKKASIEDITATGSDGLFFDEANPYSVSWARLRSSELITNLSDSMRTGVREYVYQATAEGLPPASLAKQLEGIVGLRTDQMDTLETMRAELEAAGRAQVEIDNLIAARGARQLEQRATTIARTELNAAQNAGAMNEWAQAAAQGDIPHDSKREWLDADGCPICVELAELAPVGIGEPWQSSTLGAVWAPPSHPNCRCTQALVL